MSNRESHIDLLRKILAEIEKPRGIQEEEYPFPSTLFLGDGKSISFTPRIDKMLGCLSKDLMDTWFQSHKTEFTASEWTGMVRQAFGSSLCQFPELLQGSSARSDSIHCNEMNFEEKAEAILNGIKETIADSVRNIQEHEYVFGCHIASINDLEEIRIGNVLIEPRSVWLERKHRHGKISRTSYLRIEGAWKGKKLRKRKFSRDKLQERYILDSVGDGEFVCSIRVGPVGSEARRQKALIAARIATATIALGWERPSSALNSINLIFDRQPRQQNYIRFAPDGSMTEGGQLLSYLPGGLKRMTAEQWKDLRLDLCDVFDCVSETIQYVTHSHRKASRPKLADVLFQALLWFHEGCRETMDVMAIVKFCSSMEALAGGGKSQGIVNLIKALMKIGDEAKLRADVKQLYGSGRSRTIHGTNVRLGHDWSSDRYLAEILAHGVLMGLLQRAVKHPESDYPQLLPELKL
ncbi:MAG: hypothetical protein OXG16_04145 [Rhodospirillales bacterium]|nr:hypothetical protein [Rhodospirillales bacterium]